MKVISLKLEEGLHRRLERAARQRRETKSEIVRAALQEYLHGGGGEERPPSALDLAGDLVGCADGPADLSTNSKYMAGYGK